MSHAFDNKALLRQYVAALEAGDGQAVRTLFAEDVTWTLQSFSRATGDC
jgi:ketosteroid isomerase-like protein